MGRNTPESPGNAKKRRRTSTAAATSLPHSSPVPDLVPPPLTCGYGDTVFANNPFDDGPSQAPQQMAPNMGPMGMMGMMGPRGMGPGMQPGMGPGPGGPMGHGPMGPGGPMGPMGPGGMNGPMGPGMGPGGPGMGPGMGPGGGPGMGPGGPGMGPGMGPGGIPMRMSVPNSGPPGNSLPIMTSKMSDMNQMPNNMPIMTSMGGPMHDMHMHGMGPGGPMMPGPGSGPMPPNAMPNSSRKVYPPDQPMVFNPQNPNAPPIYPCGMCHKEVHENDQAILCESGCNFWFHRMCTGLMEQAYHLLIAEVYAEWVCDRCLSSKSIPLIKFKP